jgi:tetratricopeptide (TPR) repeat protein
MPPREIQRIQPSRVPRLVPLLAAALAGCAGQKESWKALQQSELSIDILPRNAAVELDGKPVGRGASARPAVDAGRRYRLRATAGGFEPLQVEVEGSKLSGGQTALVLRPVGFGSQRRLDAGDPGGLAQAALALLRAGRLDDAQDYAARSLELGETGLAHKVLGGICARRGDRRQAVRHYSEYLVLAPDAPDAKQIAADVERMRGDLTLPAAAGK